jgi:hypothetical protein
LRILRNSFIEKALDDHEKIKLFYKIVGLDELEMRSGNKLFGNLYRKMCTVHRFLCMPSGIRSVILGQKLFNGARLDKLDVQILGNWGGENRRVYRWNLNPPPNFGGLISFLLYILRCQVSGVRNDEQRRWHMKPDT